MACWQEALVPYHVDLSLEGCWSAVVACFILEQVIQDVENEEEAALSFMS